MEVVKKKEVILTIPAVHQDMSSQASSQETSLTLGPLISRTNDTSKTQTLSWVNDQPPALHHNVTDKNPLTVPVEDADVTEAGALVTASPSSKYKLLLQTLLMAIVPTLARFLITYYTGWNGYMDLKEVQLVFTGLFFISGTLFSAVNADLKEAERIPAEIAAGLEQIEDQFVFMCRKASEPDMRPVYEQLLKVVLSWKRAVKSPDTTSTCLNELARFPMMAAEWDKRGGGGAGMINGAVDKLRRYIARAEVISRTDVLPMSHGLLRFFVGASSVILFLAQYNYPVTQVCVMLCVFTVTWFYVRLISFIDDPFDDEIPLGMSWLLGKFRQVHMYCLDEYALRVLKKQGKDKLLRARCLEKFKMETIVSEDDEDDDVAQMALETQLFSEEDVEMWSKRLGLNSKQ